MEDYMLYDTRRCTWCYTTQNDVIRCNINFLTALLLLCKLYVLLFFPTLRTCVWAPSLIYSHSYMKQQLVPFSIIVIQFFVLLITAVIITWLFSTRLPQSQGWLSVWSVRLAFFIKWLLRLRIMIFTIIFIIIIIIVISSSRYVSFTALSSVNVSVWSLIFN